MTMPPHASHSRLPRGRCQVCRGDVALRRNGVLREHRDRRHPLYGTGRAGEVPICAGSAQEPIAEDDIERGQQLARQHGWE